MSRRNDCSRMECVARTGRRLLSTPSQREGPVFPREGEAPCEPHRGKSLGRSPVLSNSVPVSVGRYGEMEAAGRMACPMNIAAGTPDRPRRMRRPSGPIARERRGCKAAADDIRRLSTCWPNRWEAACVDTSSGNPTIAYTHPDGSDSPEGATNQGFGRRSDFLILLLRDRPTEGSGDLRSGPRAIGGHLRVAARPSGRTAAIPRSGR
jgi:hypothetical protein